MNHGPVVRASLPLFSGLLNTTAKSQASRFSSTRLWALRDTAPSTTCFSCRIQAAAVAHLRRSFATNSRRQAKKTIQPIGTSAFKSKIPPKVSQGNKPRASPTETASQSVAKHGIPVSRREALRIFGEALPFAEAQAVLSDIHARRVSGSLAFDGFNNLHIPKGVQEEQLLSGLDYLRSQYPLDEEANKQAYIQRELEAEERSYLKKGQSWGLYKKSEGEDEASQSYAEGLNAVDRGSVLVQRRLAREAEKKAEKEADEKALAEGGEAAAKVAAKEKNRQLVLPWNNAELTPEQRDRNEYIEKLRQEAELSPESILANRSASSRLLKPTLFALALMVGSFFFAEFYVPPAQESRMWNNTSPSVSTCWTIAVANIMVFIAWRRPELWKMLNKNFLLAAGHPRPFSMVGNLFSHQQPGHLIVNMIALMMIGPAVHEEIGRGNFIALFLISGLGGSLANLYWNVLTRNLTTATVGASGCLYGVMGAYFTLKETLSLRIPFSDIAMEYKAETGLIVLLALELIAFWRFKGQGGIDHTSHIGGLLAGLLYAKILEARARSAAKAQQERNLLKAE